MKKRIFASTLAAVMALSLCACGGNAASSAATSAGSAAPEETKAAQEATAPAEAASTEEASAAEYGLNFSAQGFKMLSFQLKEPGSTEVIAGVATEEYIDYLEYLHGL